MTLVWDRFQSSGSELLAMLALADWCADDGGCLYPSIAKLAAKIRVSESQARRVLHGLIDQGFVRVIGNENGGAPGTTRNYQIVLEALYGLPEITTGRASTGSADARGSTDARGRTDARDGSHGCVETGSVDATQTVSRTVIEPLKGKVGRAREAKPSFDIDAGKIIGLSDALLSKWQDAYQAINVKTEIAKAEAWLLANPKNRKSDYVRFLNGWLSRAQDRAPRAGPLFGGFGARAAKPWQTDFKEKDYGQGTPDSEIDWLNPEPAD